MDNREGPTEGNEHTPQSDEARIFKESFEGIDQVNMGEVIDQMEIDDKMKARYKEWAESLKGTFVYIKSGDLVDMPSLHGVSLAIIDHSGALRIANGENVLKELEMQRPEFSKLMQEEMGYAFADRVGEKRPGSSYEEASDFVKRISDAYYA